MLPNGITGFRDSDDFYIAQQDEKIFKKFCYAITLPYHYVIVSFDIELTSKNFYSAKIKTEQGSLYLLENAYYPWIAFAKSLEFAKIEFIESPFHLPDQDVYVLTLSELQKDWHNSVSKLSKAELEQIKHWKPKTVGEIIFNFWD